MKNIPPYFYSPYEVFRSNPEPGRWIIGECDVTCTEYVIHLQKPCFIAKYNDGCEETFEDALQRAVFKIDGCLFYDIQWLDHEPDMGMQVVLFVEANAAIERYSWRVDGCGDDYS